ncbi:MAG TPA: molybdopterin-dependent oxidoreductase [Desulfosalsimonadaceae bacterium]|nr:molybdopterin-dependent oxidoreductase [Desulfosalsimonadaceae bacterium]
MQEQVYSLCFMCSIRCPIKVTVENGQIQFIEGNPHVKGIEGSLCPKGAAAAALVNDTQRVQTPMIRTGPRGSGKWRRATWEEAYDYIAEKLGEITRVHGGRAVALGERTQLSTHISKTFMRALGSPNHFTHDALCKGSLNTACRSLFGYTDGQIGFDYANTRHLVLYGRNLFEALQVKPVRQFSQAMEEGAKLTYIDPRVTVTATKAHRYWMIRPGTDLALNYALMHVIINEKLYDSDYVGKWVHGFQELQDFVQSYTPEWAEAETGIKADEIIHFARELSGQKPRVIFHCGYRCANHENEIYFRRSILILNALMGSVESKGGVFFKKGPGEVGGKPLRKLTDQEDLPKPSDVRFDKVGTRDFPLPDPNHGVPQRFPRAVLQEDPYPIKALFAYRFDPLMSIPDTNTTREALDKLDLIVSIEINYSDTAWYSDVILPESTFLERMDSPQQANGLKPQIFLRQQAVSPRYDTRPGPEILQQLARRMGVDRYFPYTSVEDLVRWQLEPTGFKLEDFRQKGFVAYTDKQILWDRESGIKFKTPSGKIEFVSSLLEDAGYASFPHPDAVASPQREQQMRLVVGRCAQHTHISTQNNLYLNELVSENQLWISEEVADKLGISEKDEVEVASGQYTGRIQARVTDMIHPECVFMLHGFGHQVPLAERSCNRGLNDSLLIRNVTDEVGGSPAFHETFVTVRQA